MKHILATLLLIAGFISCHAQDIIVMKNGERIEAKVESVSDERVTYHLFNFTEGPVFSKSKAEIKTIIFNNGMTLTTPSVKSVNGQAVSPELETTLRRLKIWSKIAKIYGFVNIGVGGLIIMLGNNIDVDEDDPYYEDFDYKAYFTTIGAIGIVEGVASVCVGYGLSSKRNRLMRENNLVGSLPLFQKEIQLEKVSIAPSVNLMSYRNNPTEGIGAGFCVKF